jgi:hypothetical protein
MSLLQLCNSLIQRHRERSEINPGFDGFADYRKVDLSERATFPEDMCLYTPGLTLDILIDLFSLQYLRLETIPFSGDGC